MKKSLCVMQRKPRARAPHPVQPVRGAVLFCAAFCAVCFTAYLISVFAHAGTFFSYALPLVMCAFVFLPPVLESRLKRYLPKALFRAGEVIYSAAVVFFTVTFCIMCVMLHGFETGMPENEGKTAVLVYGCRVSGENPTVMLKERLDTALLLLRDNPDAVCIVSGALDEGETYTEGQVMAWYLERNGISPTRIITDETAESTKGNIRAFLRLIGEHDLADYACISVSSSFHMPRIAFLCGKYGLDCTYAGAPTESFTVLFPSVVREYLAYVKMLILHSYQ